MPCENEEEEPQTSATLPRRKTTSAPDSPPQLVQQHRSEGPEVLSFHADRPRATARPEHNLSRTPARTGALLESRRRYRGSRRDRLAPARVRGARAKSRSRRAGQWGPVQHDGPGGVRACSAALARWTRSLFVVAVALLVEGSPPLARGRTALRERVTAQSSCSRRGPRCAPVSPGRPRLARHRTTLDRG